MHAPKRFRNAAPVNKKSGRAGRWVALLGSTTLHGVCPLSSSNGERAEVRGRGERSRCSRGGTADTPGRWPAPELRDLKPGGKRGDCVVFSLSSPGGEGWGEEALFQPASRGSWEGGRDFGFRVSAFGSSPWSRGPVVRGRWSVVPRSAVHHPPIQDSPPDAPPANASTRTAAPI